MNNFTMPDPQYFLFAARRDQGQLILVNPKSGQRFLMNEELLRRDYRVQLGDFLKCRTNRARELYEISQTKHTADISTVINGDEAIVVNLKVNLISQNGLLLFQCPLFDDIRCWPVIQTGRYVITMRLLNTSREMIPGKIVHFEAVDIAAQAPNERFVNSGQKVGSGFSTTAKKPEPIVGTGFSLASRTESPKPNSTVVGKRFQRPQTPKQNTKVVGSGFPSPQKQVTPANNNKVAGSGFPKPPKKEEKIVGTGFQPSKKDKNSEKPGQIVGEGFTTSQTKEEKQRAVVTSIDEKRPGLYYLWNLDSKTEGLFKTTKYVLALGHHFEGTFQKQEDGRCVCKEYKGPITELLHGGINDKEKLFLTVKITKFTPAGVNQKFSTGTAKYIGELLEGSTDETKLTAGCIGKTVKIERRGVGEKDYVWMVTKIL